MHLEVQTPSVICSFFLFLIVALLQKGVASVQIALQQMPFFRVRSSCFAIRTSVLKKKVIMVGLCKDVFATAFPNMKSLYRRLGQEAKSCILWSVCSTSCDI